MAGVVGSEGAHQLAVDLPVEARSGLGVGRRAVEVDSLPDVEHWRLEEGPRVDFHQLGGHWPRGKRETITLPYK